MAAVFAALVLTVSLVSFAYYRSSVDSTRRQAFDSLRAVARLKAEELSRWVADRYADGRSITRDTDLGARVAALARGGSAASFAQAVGPQLDALGQAGAYAAVAVLDSKSSVLWHSGASLPLLGDQTRQLVWRAAANVGTLWSDLYLGPDGKPTLDFVAPLNGPGAAADASRFVVLLRVDPSRYLFPFIQTWPGESRSAETLLVRRAGNQALYMNELRFRRDTALRLRFPLSSANLPAARAIIRGGAGIVDGPDYRGVRVFAAHRAVPGTGWHLVAKVDRSELFAGTQSLSGTLLLMALAVVLAAGLGAILVWRSRQLKLERTSAALDRARLASAERYRLLLQNANDIVLILDEDLRVIDANQCALEAYGYMRGELLGVGAMTLRCDDQQVSSADMAERLQRDGGVVTASWHARRDGSRFPVQISVSSIWLDGQRVSVAIVHDLTELRRAEQAAAERAHFLEELLEALPVPVLYKDAALRYVGCNEAFARFLGRSRDEVIGKTVFDVYPAALAKSHDASDHELLAHPERPREDEVEMPMQDGPPRSVLTHEAVFFDVGGKPAGIVGVNLDVTEIRRAEKELAESAVQLRLTLKAAVAALGTTTEMRDPYTAGHQRRVAELAGAIAAELSWDEGQIETLRTAALLHDIGKIIVPAEILSKPGRLSETEMQLIRQHAAAGADSVAEIDFEGDIAEMIRQHHERLDGSGYPAGLRGNDILLEARLLAVADVVEAVISHRPYRPALPIEEALSEIESGAGTRYDADAVAACVRLFREKGFRLVD